MLRVFESMDALMSKTRDRAELEARRLEGARLLQRGVTAAEVARRLKVSRTSVFRWEQALAANGRRGAAQGSAYRTAAAADRCQEKTIGRSARSRRLGARICY